MSAPWLDTFAAFMGGAQYARQPMDTRPLAQGRRGGTSGQEKRFDGAQDFGVNGEGN